MGEILYEFIIIVLMLAVNAVFAAYEIALASISASRLQTLREIKASGAAAALFMKEHMSGSLALVQLAITFAAALAAATGGTGVGEYLVPYLENRFPISNATAEALGIILFVIPLSIVTIVFSELVPKMVAIESNETITLLLSPVMRVLYRIFYPLVAFFEKTVRVVVKTGKKWLRIPARSGADAGLDELWAATASARSRNVLGIFDEKLANSAILFSRKKVADAMVPADLVSSIHDGASLSEAFITAHMDMHTRFPVVETPGELQTMTGYITFKDITTALKLNPANPTVHGITRPIKRIAKNMPVSRALQVMMAETTHIAAVVDKGRVVGIVTLVDIMEMIVGKIADEYDKLPSFVYNMGSSVMAGGGAAVSAVCSELHMEYNLEDMPLAQWAETRQGRPMRGGDIIRADGLEVRVRKTRRRRIVEAVVIAVR